MSRRNQDLVSRVRFEVDSRMANASMQALQTHAEKLNQQVTEVNASIKALGDVPDDNPALLEYRKQLRRLNSDLKDVNTTMKDYTRGVKAAGELYRHYAMGNIEDMSIKAIRAGVNGMKKRLDNLKAGGDPGDTEEMRLIEAITTEADVVVKRFKTDYQHVVEEIARGGTVTEQTLKRTRDGLADLMQTAETEAEKNELTNYWQKVGAAIEAVAVENRRLRGEVADREEAMRIAYATDHEGSQQAIHDAETRADAARRENDELRQRLDLKQQQRRELEQEMDINSMQVRALMDRRDELKAQEKEDRAIRNQRVDDANKELNAARRAAKTQQQAYDEQKQTVEKLRTEVQGLTDDIRKMGEVKADPKIDTSALDAMKQELTDIENQLTSMGGMHTADMKAFNERLWYKQEKMKEVGEQHYKPLTSDPDADYFNFGNKAKKIIKSFAAGGDDRRHDLMYSLAERGGYLEKLKELESEHRAIVKQRTEYMRAMDETGKRDWEEAIRQLDELDSQYSTVIAVLKDYKQQFDKIKPADDAHIEKYEQLAERRAILLEKMASVEQQSSAAQQQSTTATAAQTDAIKAQEQELEKLNQKIQKLKQDGMYDPAEGSVQDAIAERKRLISDYEKEAEKASRGMDRSKEGSKTYEKHWEEWSDADQWREAYEIQLKALQELEKAEKEKLELEQKLAAAQQQSAQSSEQLAQKQEQLSQKTAELNQQQDKLNGMVDETVTANQRLAKAEQEQTDARNAQAEAKKHEGEAVKKVEDELRGLTDEQLKNAQAYSHLTEEINTDTAAMQRNITTEQEATREADRLRSGSIDKMEQALARLRESNRKLDPTIDKEEWERGERAIGQLNLRLEELKKQSAELRREPVLDMMTQRMDQLGTLSRDALTETKKFWQAMYDGADNDADKLREIEDNLKRINTEEQKRDRKTLEERADRLQNVDNYSVGELREGIEAAKRLQDQYHLTDDELQQLSVNIVSAETRIAKVGLEAERQAQKQREQIELMQQQLANGSALTESALKAQVNYWQRLADDPKAAAEAVAQYTANMKQAQSLLDVKERVDIRMKAGRLDNMDGYSVSELREGIDAAKKMQDTFRLSNDEVQQLSEKIVAAEVRISQFSVESERQAQRQREQIALMEQQLANGSALTESALKAQVSYWQRLADDPKAAAEAVAQYTANMERAQSLLDVKERVDIRMKAGRLDNMDGYSVSELREGIDAAKKMQDTFRLSNDEVQQLSEKIVAAEVRISQFSVESERAAQRQREQIALMEQQLANGSALTESALKAQVNYWQRLADDPKAAAEAVAQYTANMKQAQDLLDQSQRADIESKAGRLQNLGAYSVSEIREGIDAAKKMQDTFHLTDAEVQELSEDIVAAEKHVSQFSVENERAAQKQREQIELMEEQLRRGTGLTETALKQQESYWRRLADDPKAAASEIARYFENLNKVHAIQKEQAESQTTAYGLNALNFFRGDTSNASADQIKEQAKALKAYRDSLPSKDKADVIAEIDGYLVKAGASAGKAAEITMNLGQALDLAAKAGSKGFAATEDEIKAAMAAIERGIEAARKSAAEYRKAGNIKMAEFNEQEIKDYEKALRGLKLEQDNVGMSHERMEKILENPIKAENLDELKAAIKRADAELRHMEGSLDDNNKQYKAMAEQVRQAKNVMKEMEGQAKASATAWEKAFNRLKTYVVMYMGFNEVWQKMSNTARDLMDLSDRMGEVRKTTGFTADEVGRLSENLKKMDVRTSLTSLMEISASAGQLGLKTLEDVQGFTEAANKLMIALPEMGREAATEMMRVAIATGEVDKIRKQLQEGTVEGSSATAVAMEKIASTIDRLRATSASTAPEITDFVKRVGAVGAQSGITIDQVAALGSTVSSLGMRIEMSATALSRMIPAIRNNAFELAKAIGVTPDTIRNLFDTGRGMEVILMILQRIKDTGMDADSVEQMLGMAGMRDIMKDLNQQGARAGIVFSGLSQNVDELRRQLGVANQAYEENIAIQQEFDKMNETTAAKWERLKNAFEEAFVSDKAQRFLGTVIDGLRKIVDLLMGGGGLTTALATISTLVLVLKTNIIGIMWSAIALGLTKVIDLFKNWRIALDLVILKIRALTAAQWANIFVAAASAVAMLVYSLRNAANAMSETSKAMGEVEKQLHKQMTAADKLFRSLAKVREQERVAALAAKEQAKAETEKGKAVEQSADKTDKLSKETDKLAGSEKKAAEQTAKVEEGMKRVNAEGKESARIIREINSKYGAYLGYMLSETASAKQLAEARELINKKLRETITLKQKEAALSDIEQEYGGKVRKGASSTDDLIASYFGSNDEAYARVSVAVSEAAQKYAKDQKKFQAEVQKIVMANRQFISQSAKKDFRDAYAQSGRGASDNEIASSIASNIGARAESYRASVEEYQKQVETAERVFDARSNVLRKESRESAMRTLNSIMADWKDALARYQKAEGEEKEKLAVEVYKQQRSYNNMFANNADYFTNDKRKGTIERSIENMKSYEKGLRQVADESIRAVDAAERAESKIQNTDFTNGNEGSSNSPWGTSERADSTTYTEMTAEQLVNRRKQMNDFVNSIQTDTDVKAVLNEDKALKKAIEAGMSSDMRTVIEWYNTERLKIQDELHARHLTNTGDWMDPKKERGAKKQFRDEMDAYLHELDAYYTERKTRIEEAGTDEGLTEAEIRNRTLANEMEWQQRRAELQKLYSRKQQEVTQEELEAIYHIISERTGDTESFVKAQIAKTNQFVDAIEKSGDKGAAIVHRWMSQVELDTERSYLKGQQALTKQMKAIEDIIDKERPFNGITKQLRESLSTMDILTGDMRKEYDELMKAGKDMRDFNERQGRAELQRTTFLLGQAEQAYSTTIDRVMQQMRENGMGQWADWLAIRPDQQEALMAQLRQTYDAIQDAIKKEASQLKKQAEIMWNNILVPGGDGKTTLKQMLDRTVAQLGIDQGRVSRANSLIGAGASSERVADKLAIQQMRLQLTMQEHYYNLMKKQGRAHVDMLNQQADAAERRGNAEEATRKRLDAQHAEMALNLATAKEETELAKQREEIIARTEESQNRLYTELRSWADLLTSSLQGVMEASHAGDAEYYNERAKLNLTGKGGPGAGTYVVIDDAGTSDATAHYEYLDERQALERQHEIEVQNAQAEAWRKLMDDLNMKMSEQITDWMNGALQSQSIDANTQAVIANTEALWAQLGQTGGQQAPVTDGYRRNADGFAMDEQGQTITPVQPVEMPTAEGETPAWKPAWQMTEEERAKAQENMTEMFGLYRDLSVQTEAEKAAMLTEIPGYTKPVISTTEEDVEKVGEISQALAQKQMEADNQITENKIQNDQRRAKSEKQADNQIANSAQSSFAKMTQAANLYGIAYQTMSNDNLSTAQKFQMFALQAAGNAAIAMLTTNLFQAQADQMVKMPGILGKLLGEMPYPAAIATYAAVTALMGGLMGLAASQVSKSKSQIAQATGASVGAGRLSTGMLTYAEGNVNELTDPASLTPGRQYNVDGADGKTYRARYMGKGAKTHITNGPEFHLVGEAGREAIIDAKTTRLLQMNETGIWRDIQTLYNGGSISGLSTRRRRGTGMPAFADGNVGEFEEMADGGGLTAEGTGGMSADVLVSMLETNSRLADLLENALANGIKAVNKWTGSDGIPAMYNKMQKEAQRHGEKYL